MSRLNKNKKSILNIIKKTINELKEVRKSTHRKMGRKGRTFVNPNKGNNTPNRPHAGSPDDRWGEYEGPRIDPTDHPLGYNPNPTIYSEDSLSAGNSRKVHTNPLKERPNRRRKKMRFTPKRQHQLDVGADLGERKKWKPDEHRFDQDFRWGGGGGLNDGGSFYGNPYHYGYGNMGWNSHKPVAPSGNKGPKRRTMENNPQGMRPKRRRAIKRRR